MEFLGEIERKLLYYKDMVGLGALTINEVRIEEDYFELTAKSGDSLVAVFLEGDDSSLLTYADDRTYFFDDEDEKKRILDGGLYKWRRKVI